MLIAFNAAPGNVAPDTAKGLEFGREPSIDTRHRSEQPPARGLAQKAFGA